eukprot:scaffold8592_cov15-Tisochrysis_lutea.AAC.1
MHCVSSTLVFLPHTRGARTQVGASVSLASHVHLQSHIILWCPDPRRCWQSKFWPWLSTLETMLDDPVDGLEPSKCGP